MEFGKRIGRRWTRTGKDSGNKQNTENDFQSKTLRWKIVWESCSFSFVVVAHFPRQTYLGSG
jgi:hypothetical protein